MATWDDNNPLLRELFHRDSFEDLVALARTTRKPIKDITRDAVEAYRVKLTTPSGKGRKPQS